MEHSNLNFNNALKSTDHLLNKSLENRIQSADAISREISDDEIMADVFRKRSQALENILENEKLDIDAGLILKKILETNNEIIATYQELKKVSLFKETSDGVINMHRPGNEFEFSLLSQTLKDLTDDEVEYIDILKINHPDTVRLLLKYLDPTVQENRTN